MVYKLNLFPLYNSLITFGSQDEQVPNIGLLYSGFWIKSPIDILYNREGIRGRDRWFTDDGFPSLGPPWPRGDQNSH